MGKPFGLHPADCRSLMAQFDQTSKPRIRKDAHKPSERKGREMTSRSGQQRANQSEKCRQTPQPKKPSFASAKVLLYGGEWCRKMGWHSDPPAAPKNRQSKSAGGIVPRFVPSGELCALAFGESQDAGKAHEYWRISPDANGAKLLILPSCRTSQISRE